MRIPGCKPTLAPEEGEGCGRRPPAEKLATLQTEDFFRERVTRVDREGFLRILSRQRGQPPRPDDEIPGEAAAA